MIKEKKKLIISADLKTWKIRCGLTCAALPLQVTWWKCWGGTRSRWTAVLSPPTPRCCAPWGAGKAVRVPVPPLLLWASTSWPATNDMPTNRLGPAPQCISLACNNFHLFFVFWLSVFVKRLEYNALLVCCECWSPTGQAWWAEWLVLITKGFNTSRKLVDPPPTSLFIPMLGLICLASVKSVRAAAGWLIPLPSTVLVHGWSTVLWCEICSLGSGPSITHWTEAAASRFIPAAPASAPDARESSSDCASLTCERLYEKLRLTSRVSKESSCLSALSCLPVNIIGRSKFGRNGGGIH